MSFCEGPLWDWQLAWNSSNPNLTECFQNSVLIWVPCGVLCVATIIDLVFRSQRTLKLPWTALNISRLALCAILAAIQIVDIWNVSQLSNYQSVELYAPIIQLFAFLLAGCLDFFNKSTGKIISVPLFFFYLLYTVATAIKFRSVMVAAFTDDPGFFAPNKTKFTLTVLTFAVATMQLIFVSFADRRISYYKNEHKSKGSPENDASILSLFWFWWFNGMIALGYKRVKEQSGLRMEDMYELDENLKTEGIIKDFMPLYEKEVEKTKNHHSKHEVNNDSELHPGNQVNILYPLMRNFGWPIFGSALLMLVSTLLRFMSPILINALITFVESDDPMWKGVFLAFCMFLSSMVESLVNSQYEYKINRIATQVRSAVIHVVYRKALRLSGEARGKYTAGEIVTIMSVDTQRIMEQVTVVNLLWSMPLQVGIAIYMLWQQLGVAALAGIAILIILMPLNAVTVKYFEKYYDLLMEDKDKRTKLMNEILSGIRVLKLYAWEKCFINRIDSVREKEIFALRIQAWIGGAMILVFESAPFLIGLACFGTYVLSNSSNVLDANKVFVSLSVISIVERPIGLLPIFITSTAIFLVSLRRVNVYLNAEELDDNAVQRIREGKTTVSIKDGSFQYGRTDKKPVLRDINMEIKDGQLVAVVGTIGTGKSTLLGALLGDVFKKSGTVKVAGSVAYVPQQAWIQGTSIKNNILFGHPYNRDRYERALDTCALRPDLAILPAGDETEVGERGINLSGGQKQRISLARAVYSNGDVYLFDDPLSAVDSHVSKHIFENVISNDGILSSKTRILVTHRLSVLEACDVVYVLKDGTISEWGTYRQLVARKGAFAEFLIEHLQSTTELEEIPEDELKLMENIVKEGAAPPQLMRQFSNLSGGDSDVASDSTKVRRRASRARTESNASSRISKSKDPKIASVGADGALTKAEESASGSVQWKIYKDYIMAMGVLSTLISVFSFVFYSTIKILLQIWLSEWSEDSVTGNTGTAQINYRLGVYGALSLVATFLSFSSAASLHLSVLKGGQVLHEKMLSRVMRAPLSFFDTTPMGRILNRFSKDVDTADTSMRFNLRQFLSHTSRTLSSMILIALQTPIFLLFVLPLAVLYYIIQKYYIATSRQLKRIESTSRSPIYVHFSETLSGCASIRAYGAQKRFIHLSNEKNDINQSAFYPSLAALRWLSVRLEFLGYVIIFIAALLAVLSRDTLSAGYAGLSMTAALTITGTLSSLVKASSDTETNFVSIERCLEYSDVETEAPWEIESVKPNNEWPEDGAIEFHDYSTRYREGLPLVVKNINVQIHPGEKVGVVGRTGAGKSSLTLALFRLIEPADGYISIDSVNVTRIGLHDLRSRLTIIPQDPILFSGTIRNNIDPVEEKTDEELWVALEQSHLKEFVKGLELGLTHEVIEGGENMSVGQRQLVCLARALLRKTKILILDEATAAVDMETDNLIQETLKKEFSDSTTLTIAHRLNTIIDYDRILVLSDGRVVEYDTPRALLNNKDSVFYAMAKDAGIV